MFGLSVSKDTVVRLLTIILTPLVSVGAGWLAKHGFNIGSPAALVTVMAVAGASVLILGLHWLERQPIFKQAEMDAEAFAHKVSGLVASDPALLAVFDEVKSKLEANKGDILAELEKVAHLSPSAEAIVQQLIKAAGAGSQPAPATPVVVDPTVVPEDPTVTPMPLTPPPAA